MLQLSSESRIDFYIHFITRNVCWYKLSQLQCQKSLPHFCEYKLFAFSMLEIKTVEIINGYLATTVMADIKIQYIFYIQ